MNSIINYKDYYIEFKENKDIVVKLLKKQNKIKKYDKQFSWHFWR